MKGSSLPGNGGRSHACEIVRRKDGRPLRPDGAQPSEIEFRTEQPLHMDDVGIEGLKPAARPPHARTVLKGFQRKAGS